MSTEAVRQTGTVSEHRGCEAGREGLLVSIEAVRQVGTVSQCRVYCIANLCM